MARQPDFIVLHFHVAIAYEAENIFCQFILTWLSFKMAIDHHQIPCITFPCIALLQCMRTIILVIYTWPSFKMARPPDSMYCISMYSISAIHGDNNFSHLYLTIIQNGWTTRFHALHFCSRLGENRAMISALSIQHRALPPRPIPCTSAVFTSNPFTQLPPQQYTHDPCLRPDNPPPPPAGLEEEENPYTTFHPVSHFSGRNSSVDTESDDHAKSTTSQGSSNEDEIYCEPYDWVLKPASSGMLT